jgi:ATP synthase protein I
MNEEYKANIAKEGTIFSRQVGTQAARKLKAQRRATRSIWFGLGMSGLIGWSVTVPTLIGAAIGIWVDKHYPTTYSWTLMLLLMGLLIGCANAWHWVDSEYKQMQEDSVE